MQTHALKLVTIIAEPALEHRLTSEIKELGASGFSVTEGRGEGSRGGSRGVDVPGSHVRLEALVPPEVAERIVEHVARHYFADYSLIAYTTDVEVVRTRKFAAPTASAAIIGG